MESEVKVAAFSLTRDRFYYTQHCFKTFREKAGYPVDHYIVDNGSQDGTVDWLLENEKLFTHIQWNFSNLGLCAGNNQALDMIRKSGIQYDLIFKFDNDAEVISDNIVAEMVDLYKQATKPMLLSPRVTGISRQPRRSYTETTYSHPIGVTNHIGGLFSWCNADLYLQYTYPDNLPLASGDDSAFAYWVYQKRYIVGYVEDLIVNHYEGTEGQNLRYPQYFERKWKEEKEIVGEEATRQKN
jgi:glycosyltransferase involved in cell wall biosynthesis